VELLDPPPSTEPAAPPEPVAPAEGEAAG